MGLPCFLPYKSPLFIIIFKINNCLKKQTKNDFNCKQKKAAAI